MDTEFDRELNRAGPLERHMSSRYHEPCLEDMLVDSIVKAVMEADGVDPCKLEAELHQTAALLRAIRHTPKSRQE